MCQFSANGFSAIGKSNGTDPRNLGCHCSSETLFDDDQLPKGREPAQCFSCPNALEFLYAYLVFLIVRFLFSVKPPRTLLTKRFFFNGRSLSMCRGNELEPGADDLR
ncbi:unnamed protein product [Nippostrongylus brasiliensis]|uniref:Uncharacterized protein n=1 Tax=Nippostrongylus brasiliensis TaxID=27835 RepID=A0A0N4Y5R9_NIPBR|nr:unnamed protein product [Nippostrongylus brasiliensis]